MIKCQLSDTWDSNWCVLVTKQCQLNWILRQQEDSAGTIDIFDYQTANAGTSPPTTPPFLQGDENHRVFIWKNKGSGSKHLIF